MKKIPFILILSFLFGAAFAQLQSPGQFLGYSIGSRFTPHYKIVEYFKYVANSVPAQVQLKQYGETYAHRPLYTAVVSSATNINNIESIRQNNLALSNGKGNNTSIPIVWLSYNVHGNEASSSEASMMVLYALADASNTQTQNWLQHTVVIIDPCLNPDGRERYVNWYSDVVGKNPNPNLDAREHHEPWPGGRLNHYNFDLNRDWAWQTQKETQERIKAYQQWMPQIHVDFHEQGVNDPYYFAPAAEPYHEAITQWQKDFQVSIGKNNAKYFDKNGWLFFTNEIFDLFYPSYGDTYPMFNGAIGMTYEQGGGPAGGLAANTYAGDTLTLAQRAEHHYTTSLSTIETASVLAQKLVAEFGKYFQQAVAGDIGTYKSYVVKVSQQTQQNATALKALLTRNNIQYGTGSGTGKGYNYFTGKEENFSYSTNDIVINAAQPQAVLVKALMEPQTKLNDTITYDITAWALPYAYGLQTYASRTAISQPGKTTMPMYTELQDAYGYIIPWEGVASAKIVAGLLQKGIRLRYAEKPFTANGRDFPAGSIIVLKNGNTKSSQDLLHILITAAKENSVAIYTVRSGLVDKGLDFGSSSVHFIKPPKVALITGEQVNPNAAGEIWHFFDQELNYPITLINAKDVDNINLSDYEVIILPTGRYSFLANDEKASKLHEWIEGGGKLIALENAVAQISKLKWSAVKAKDNDDKKEDSNYAYLQKYERRERDALSGSTPGAIYKVEVDNTHPLMFGYGNEYYTLKMDNEIYDFIKDGGWNVGVIKKTKPVAGYVGYKLKQTLQDGLVFGVQDMGRGAITFLADDVMFRSFWQNGKLILCNAVFLVGQ